MHRAVPDSKAQTYEQPILQQTSNKKINNSQLQLRPHAAPCALACMQKRTDERTTALFYPDFRHGQPSRNGSQYGDRKILLLCADED
jgi:hypothetical protein